MQRLPSRPIRSRDSDTFAQCGGLEKIFRPGSRPAGTDKELDTTVGIGGVENTDGRRGVGDTEGVGFEEAEGGEQGGRRGREKEADGEVLARSVKSTRLGVFKEKDFKSAKRTSSHRAILASQLAPSLPPSPRPRRTALAPPPTSQ